LQELPRTIDIPGVIDNQAFPAPFTGYIATDKSISFTIQSPDPTLFNAVAVSSAKLSGKTISGDMQVLPYAGTGFFSVRKK
jgi:hypothetical protein